MFVFYQEVEKEKGGGGLGMLLKELRGLRNKDKNQSFLKLF